MTAILDSKNYAAFDYPYFIAAISRLSNHWQNNQLTNLDIWSDSKYWKLHIRIFIN